MPVTQIPKPKTAFPKHRQLHNNSLHKKRTAKAAQALCDAFVFEDAIEGHAFWWQVYTRLTRLANGDETLGGIPDANT